MSEYRKRKEEYGPVITCGAVGVSMSDGPDNLTSIDHLISAIKRLSKKGHALPDDAARQSRGNQPVARRGKKARSNS